MSKTNDFELNNVNLALLQSKNKIYTYLAGRLDTAYFKLTSGKFLFALSSGDGILTTTLDVDYDGDTEYFSTEWSKWSIALQKFAGADKLKLSHTKSYLKLWVDGTSNVVTLSTSSFDADSQVAKRIDEFVPTSKTDIISCNHKLELTPEVANDFELVNSLFSSQNRVNSIGLSKTDVMYSDRSVVVKANLSNPLDDELFSNIDPDDNHIYIHTYILKLFELLKDFNTSIYFDSDYEVVYWADDNTELIIYSDSKNVSLPTQEQFEGIQPVDKNVFVEIPIIQLKESLEFFNGFYDGSAWKPIKFILKQGEDVLLYYKNPVTEAKYSIEGVKSAFNGEFILESETLRKILAKIKVSLEDDKSASIKITFDPSDVEEGAPGVYCQAGSIYEFIISKLLDD